MADSFNCRVETDWLLPVTDSHVDLCCVDGNILKRVQGKDIVSLLESLVQVTYGLSITAISVDLDLHSHSSIASLFECDFSYSCAPVDKVSIDRERRAVSLQQQADNVVRWCLSGTTSTVCRQYIDGSLTQKHIRVTAAAGAALLPLRDVRSVSSQTISRI